MNEMSFNVSLLVSCAALGVFASASNVRPQKMQYQELPGRLARDAPRVGEWIGDVEFNLLEGTRASLTGAFGERGLLVAMRDPECPLSKKYAPRLKSLEEAVADMGFGLLYVGMDSEASARKDVQTYGLGGAYAVDPEGLIARELDARTSTEVFVIDAGHTLVYRGMIDDQYGLGFAKVAAERHYLADALEAARDGREVEVPATTAHGCLLDIDAPERGGPAVTYHNRISRIVQRRCQRCHREGEAGPFELSNYREVKKRRSMIQWALEEHIMPPWFAAQDSGPWLNDTRLTAGEMEDFMRWIQDGAPEGDAQEAPLEHTWVEGWSIGQPDLIVSFPEAYQVPAEGIVDYQYFYAPTNLPEGKWVKAVEIRSSGKAVVHHALVFAENPLRKGERRGNTQKFNTGGGSFFASAVPGQSGLTFPEGTGKYLPAQTSIKFQMHYTPNGTATLDQTSVGFIFSDEPLVEVRTNSAINEDFLIPAHAFDYEVSGDFRFPEAGTLLTLFPHTHLRGVRFEGKLIFPNGEVQPLLELPFYDFNWQLNYRLADPIDVPAGTLLRASAWYDNSAENPANPDPNIAVRFGEQTFDEMMILYVNWIASSSRVIEAGSRRSGAGRR